MLGGMLVGAGILTAGVIAAIVLARKIFSKKQELEMIQKLLEEVGENYSTLHSTAEELQQTISQYKHEKEYLAVENQMSLEKLNQLNETFAASLKNQTQMSSEAFTNFFEVLEKDYAELEEAYDEAKEALGSSYAEKEEELKKNLAIQKEMLDSITATREAAMAAKLKEQEIKDKLAFYCLQIEAVDKKDIALLQSVKKQLTKPRVLSMLIWSTFYQKQMTTLCNNVLGTQTVCGIYKITNQNNDMCYIGQSVDVSTRWKQHAKCGLGIDTPAGNKLYKAMMEDGIDSFSWELLEACPREQLNEKEKKYIEIYQSYDYGYNNTKGNN